ncbi:tol-pal system protein YbgF [Pseudidiomarina sp.]|uniref:tol-pal system protein YbgF n=1 Tax=Pseudidiomarina sp. TaxID=2081707 RepID=UPI00299E526A|nr:tol-pal system protein YbgF [Pseudidiomarina sp.]MDX1706682.1 tol-pal system protein YbgF [Pseudidiomarina sp.]
MQKLIIVLAFLIPGAVLAQAPVSKLGSGSVEERLSQLERVMDARNSAQMAMLDQMNTLQNEVAELRGRTEEHAHQLEQILLRQREIYQEIDRRLASQPTTPVVATGGADSAMGYSANVSENDAYDQAIKLVLEDKRYDAAIPAFQQFLERFPDSTYAANAHYWLGQLLFADGKYDAAKKEFNTVVEKFPDSNKRGDCLLKLGIIAQQQNQPQQARSYFQKVLNEYSGSTEATLAQKRLNEL